MLLIQSSLVHNLRCEFSPSPPQQDWSIMVLDGGHKDSPAEFNPPKNRTQLCSFSLNTNRLGTWSLLSEGGVDTMFSPSSPPGLHGPSCQLQKPVMKLLSLKRPSLHAPVLPAAPRMKITEFISSDWVCIVSHVLNNKCVCVYPGSLGESLCGSLFLMKRCVCRWLLTVIVLLRRFCLLKTNVFIFCGIFSVTDTVRQTVRHTVVQYRIIFVLCVLKSFVTEPLIFYCLCFSLLQTGIQIKSHTKVQH